MPTIHKWCLSTAWRRKKNCRDQVLLSPLAALLFPFSPLTALSLKHVPYAHSLLRAKHYTAQVHYLALSLAAPSPTLESQLLRALPVSCLLMRLWENCGEGLVELGMIWPAGVSPWAQRPLHRSIMRTLMAVKWLARNEKLPSSVRVMVSLGPLSPFKGNSLRSVGFLCVPAHVNYRQWRTISCFTRTSPRSYIIATRAAVPG